ncbi:MAG: KilA-N domain-containing protein, partial [Coriobacteriales bacterium]|nr:KilA-N domain-containing protein [Coriobacteriales bacterium]
MNEIITVRGREVALYKTKTEDYLSLTDIARYRNGSEPSSVINAWMRNYATVEFIGLWETVNNPDFKPIEFERFKAEAGRHYFALSPQRWIKTTNAVGIISKSGRYGGGTFAHSEIAFEFATWVSSEFKLYLITEFKRLKTEEQQRLSLEWNLQRTLAKINYRVHTDAIKER